LLSSDTCLYFEAKSNNLNFIDIIPCGISGVSCLTTSMVYLVWQHQWCILFDNILCVCFRDMAFSNMIQKLPVKRKKRKRKRYVISLPCGIVLIMNVYRHSALLFTFEILCIDYGDFLTVGAHNDKIPYISCCSLRHFFHDPANEYRKSFCIHICFRLMSGSAMILNTSNLLLIFVTVQKVQQTNIVCEWGT